jgi:NADH-quinone oxidoreductase subunit H
MAIGVKVMKRPEREVSYVRATLPRLRYDQLMSLGWKILLPLATLNALITAIILVVTD